MPAPLLIPAGMTLLRIGGKWVLKKIAKKLAKRSAKKERKLRKKTREAKKKEASRYQKNLETPVSKLKKRDVKKRLKELKGTQKARRKKTEKDLEGSDALERVKRGPSPTITRIEAVAKATAKKEALIQRRKAAEEKLNPIVNKAIAKLNKDFPDIIGGSVNLYGRGKGLGKKIERITGTNKKSTKRNRQYKKENEKIAKQRRQRGEPERREVRRPKSGLYEDTPKKTEGTRQGQKIKNERLRKRKRIYQATEKAKAEKQKRTRELKEDAKRRRN